MMCCDLMCYNVVLCCRSSPARFQLNQLQRAAIREARHGGREVVEIEVEEDVEEEQEEDESTLQTAPPADRVLCLRTPVPTRWNSTYIMVER